MKFSIMWPSKFDILKCNRKTHNKPNFLGHRIIEKITICLKIQIKVIILSLNIFGLS
jgi:hypothetical protein